MYRFRIKHIPGKLNAAPDCTSRYPVSPKYIGTEIKTTQNIDGAIQASVISSYTHDPNMRAITWDKIVAAAATDEECRILAEYIQNGFPNSHHDLPPNVRQFWTMREQLYCLENVSIKENKILIPKQLRAEVLKPLHSAHQGVNGMMANARQRFFWPGLDASIRQTRAQCRTCNMIALSQPKEPVKPRIPIPENGHRPLRPSWEKLYGVC